MNAAASGGAVPPMHAGMEVWMEREVLKMSIPNVPNDSESTFTKAIDFSPFVRLVPSKIHLI